MAKPRDLELNTIDRYQKRSDRLVLESYSSCDVPLGCGGSLLRWVDPEQALPLVLRTDFGDRKATVFLDGEEINRPRVMVTPSKHVLSIEFASLGAPLSFRLSLGYDRELVQTQTRFKLPTHAVSTEIAERWFATTSAPRGAWKTDAEEFPGFVSLRAMPAPSRSKNNWLDPRIAKLPSIGLSSKPGMVWVRTVFSARCDDGAWEVE